MSTIPSIPQRQFVPQYTQAPIQDGALTAISQVAGDIGMLAAYQYRQQKQARDVTAVNDAVIEYEVKNLDDVEAFQKANAENPVGKTQEYDQTLRDNLTQIADTMPSPAAKLAFNREAANIRLRTNVQLKNWENKQELQNFALASDKTSDNLNTLAYRQKSFATLPNLLNQVDATKVSDSTFVSPVEAEKMRLDRRRSVTANTFLGVIDSNVGQAEAMLNSKKYDADLGTEGVIQVSKLIDQKKKQDMALRVQLESLKSTDPYKYMASVGDTKGLAPLEFGTAGTTESFTQRQRYIDRAKYERGVELPLLTEQEVNGISKTLEKMDDESATIYIRNLQSSITPEQYLPLTKQLFEKNPALGIGLAIANNQPDATRQIIKGNALIKNKATALPQDSDFTEAFYQKLGNAIKDPYLRQTTLQAVKAHYAADAQDNGLATNSGLDTTTFDKSVEAVLGPIVETGKNSAKTMSFQGTFGKNKQKRFLDQDEFDNVLSDMTSEDIIKTSGYMPTALNGDEITVNQIRKRGELQAIGDGKYRVIMNGEFIPNKKKNAPFILDLKAIQGRQK